MIIDYEFKSGLVFGLESDQLIIFDEESQEMQEDPANVIYLHMGILTLAFIFGQ